MSTRRRETFLLYEVEGYSGEEIARMQELVGLPNTVAGFGLAFLALRQSVGASNVVLGPDIEQNAA